MPLLCCGVKHDFDPLDRHYVTSRISFVTNIVLEILKCVLRGQKYALTSDHWTSTGGTTFLAVTCHFIIGDRELVSLTPSCTEHSGRIIAADCKIEIKAVLEFYQLETKDAVALVTDTENTMTLLGKITQGARFV